MKCKIGVLPGSRCRVLVYLWCGLCRSRIVRAYNALTNLDEFDFRTPLIYGARDVKQFVMFCIDCFVRPK